MPHPLADRRRLLGLALLAGLVVVLAAPAQDADAPKPGKLDGPQADYFNEKSFEIPLQLLDRNSVTQVTLWVSTDAVTFKAVNTASPDAKKFVYHAQAEGWHYFVVQVEDRFKRKVPAKVGRDVIDRQVCIDLKKPDVTLNPCKPDEKLGNVAVEWSVTDDQEVDAKRLRLEYRAAKGKQWTPLKVRPIAAAQFSFSPPDAGEYEVRVTGYDKAGNFAQATTKVTATVGGGTAPGPAEATTPNVTHVKSKTFKLEYKIENVGASKVKHVEVWRTRDTRAWVKISDEVPGDGFELKVGEAGRYGFSLRPVSGVGRAARPPAVNEAPQIWIEVDETPPVVDQVEATVSNEDNVGTLTVTWRATDQWLRKSDGISISISEQNGKDAQWTPVASNLPNTGSAKIKPVSEKIAPHTFYVRVSASDEAGNVGHAQTTQPVTADLTEPKAIDVKVKQ